MRFISELRFDVSLEQFLPYVIIFHNITSIISKSRMVLRKKKYYEISSIKVCPLFYTLFYLSGIIWKFQPRLIIRHN